MRGPRWTEEQDRQLAFDWGVFRIETIAKRLNRTVSAVVERAKKLKLGAPSRGTETVGGLAKRTGYHETQIENAAKLLGIHIGRRVSTTISQNPHPNRRFTAIDEEDVEKILAFLKEQPDGKRIRLEKPGVWGSRGRGGKIKPTHCKNCGSDEHPYYAKDLCTRCYDRLCRKVKSHGAAAGC